MPFNLRPEDQRLIEAAIALGEWLAASPAITTEQLHCLRTVQAVLRRLPEDTRALLDARYGFRIAPPALTTGVARSWTVSLSRHAPGEPGILEIFNAHFTLPAGDPLKHAPHESCFYLEAGEENRYQGDWRELIDELTHPPSVAADAVQIAATYVPTWTRMRATYYGDWRTWLYECRHCPWRGPGSALRAGDLYPNLQEFNCPECDELIEVVTHPTFGESRANWDKLSEAERRSVEHCEAAAARFHQEKLKDPTQLPDVAASEFSLMWDYSIAGEGPEDERDSRTLITWGDQVLWSEPAVYEGFERFAEVARILKTKYGARVRDLLPTQRSRVYLWGDHGAAPGIVDRYRREIFGAEPAT